MHEDPGPWIHVGSIDSPGTGAEIGGEGGPQPQLPAPVARFTARRKAQAREIRARRQLARRPRPTRPHSGARHQAGFAFASL